MWLAVTTKLLPPAGVMVPIEVGLSPRFIRAVSWLLVGPPGLSDASGSARGRREREAARPQHVHIRHRRRAGHCLWRRRLVEDGHHDRVGSFLEIGVSALDREGGPGLGDR